MTHRNDRPRRQGRFYEMQDWVTEYAVHACVRDGSPHGKGPWVEIVAYTEMAEAQAYVDLQNGRDEHRMYRVWTRGYLK